MSNERDFLEFLVADSFTRETMDLTLRLVYEELERKMEVSLVASGGESVPPDRLEKIVNETPCAKEARAAYLTALESYEGVGNS